MKLSEFKKLIADLEATTISRLEIDSEDLKVKIDWHRPGQPTASTPSLTIVRAPIAGTFYRTGEGDKPLVSEGSSVAVGEVLCMIDADGVLNEIEAVIAGQIATIPGQNGTRVEMGAALFEIKEQNS